MKIVRYQTPSGDIEFGSMNDSGAVTKLTGDIYQNPQASTEPARIQKLLAPIEPTSIQCIGLNYRRHAAETGAKLPEYPVLFFKGLNTLQHPDQPIQLPTFLKSEQVDYECELAVVIS